MDTAASKIIQDLDRQIHVLESRLMSDHEFYHDALAKIRKHFDLLKDMLVDMARTNGQEVPDLEV